MWIVIGLSLVCSLLVMPSLSRGKGKRRPLFKGTGQHWKRNYSRRTFLRLGGGILGAGLLAYSGVDEILEGWHSSNVRSSVSDKISHGFKIFGERFWFMNWLMIGAVDAWLRTNSFTRWGRKNFEAMVVGLPTLWTVQRVLGANRPSSDDGNPRWRPMNADNSASGHTFIAAVPWLTLARRSPTVAVPVLAKVASVLTGWSRLNDRKHYVSQIALGWVIAWNAVCAVDDDAHLVDISGPNDSTEEARDDSQQ